MCDHTTLHTTLSERDGDKRALAELKRQLANESGLKAELTKAKIKELKTQIKAEKAMKSALDKSRARFTKNLKNVVKLLKSLKRNKVKNIGFSGFPKKCL